MNSQLKRRINLLEVRALVAAPPSLPPRPPLRQPKDVVELLAEQVEAVRQDPTAEPLDRARTLALVGALALRAMEAADGRARVESLERALKARAEQQRAAEKQKREQ